jgi:GNAT superfamily N-acetyltransferase
MIEARQFFGTDLADTYTLRPPDGRDNGAFHVVIYADGTPAAAGRLLVLNDAFEIDQIIVHPDRRRQYLGTLAVKLLIRAAFTMGGERQITRPPEAVKPFFIKCGFTDKGETMEHNGDAKGTCQA